MSGEYEQHDGGTFDSSSLSLSLHNCSPTSEFSCLIDYYARHQSYRALHECCSKTLASAPAHPEAKFWRCFAVIAGNDRGADTEAIRDLENLLHDVHNAPEYNLASIALLIIAHKKQARADVTAVDKYKESLKSLSKTSDTATLLIAGRYFLHSDKLKQAKQCFDKIVSKATSSGTTNKEYLAALVYSCFLLSHSAAKDNSRGLKKSLILVEEVLSAGLTDINALHCHANILLRQGKLHEAVNSLNLIHVTYPNYLPCLVDKCSLLFLLNNFDEALVIAYKILKISSTNIFALFNLLLYFLCKEGASSIAIKERFNDLVHGLDRSEGNEYYFYFYFGSILARMSQASKPVLLMAQSLLTMAINKYKSNHHNENNCALLLEQAYISELLGDSSAAAVAYNKASKSDNGESGSDGGDGVEVTGLLGLTRVKLTNLKFREAAQELELISELIENNSLNSKYKSLNYLNLSYLKSKLAYEYHGDHGAALSLIIEFFDIYASYLSNNTHSNAYEFYSSLQNELLVSAINLYLLLIPAEPRLPSESENTAIVRLIKILNDLLTRIPGYFHAHLLKAKLFYLNGQLSDAEDLIITVCQALDSNNASLYIVLSYVYFAQENYKLSSQSLEQSRALDFEIRNSVDYHLLKARLLFLNGQIDEAKQVALAALTMINNHFNALKNSDKRAAGKLTSAAPAVNAVTRHDRLGIIVELMKCYGTLNDFTEADKLLNQSRPELTSSLESSRLTLAAVDLALTRKDADTALTLLRSIDSDSPHYTRAKLKMADIYLTIKHNRKAYLACHQDLFTVAPTINHQLLIAEAYLAVQEPEQAIQMFEQALSMGGEPELYSKIGRAMIATHDYSRACDYYEQAIHSAANSTDSNDPAAILTVIALLHELAALLFKMRRYPEAQSVLDRALSSIGQINERNQSIKLLALKVECQLLDSEIALANQNNDKHLECLNDCINTQNNLLALYESRAVKNSVQYSQAKEFAANLNAKLGIHYQTSGQNTDQSIIYYTEALKHLPSHSQSLFNLSKLYYSISQYEESKNMLIQLLRFNPAHSEAQLFLADLHYELANFEHCIYHLQNLMENNELKHLRFEACSKIIHILRRHGRLLDGAKILKSCEKSIINGAKLAGDKKILELESSSSSNKGSNLAVDGSEDTAIYPTAPGLHYCKGLYYYYCSHPRSALFHFNLARKSHEWGDRALYFMIEIYLNPDHLELFSDVTAENDADKGSGSSKFAQNLSYARQLMTELHSHENAAKQSKYQILENYILLSSKSKSEIERAINSCLSALTVDPNYVPALLCLANAYHLLQQPAKTRNYLKRISKMKLNHEHLVEFEKAFLFLAEIYLQIGKFELSTELCKKTLSLNKSNGKAWEIMGGIMEKEAAYRDAAENYEQAWYNSQQSDVNIGFKLAFNYLKCKKFVEAIDVCHQALRLNADQPKLRKEILDKARAALRP